MKKIILGLLAASFISVQGIAQCTTTNATSCVCPPAGGTDCDLLPDIKISVDALQSSYTVYTQSGNGASGSQGSNDGRLRLTGTTPNIGYGPLETRSINKWLCGTDTLLSNPGTLCPDGKVPKRFVVQRIYHKNGTVMSYTEVPCGTMTYHPSHGHMHVDNWGVYTMRIQNPNDPDPTHWSIVGTGTKLAFCLLDIASCDNGNGIYCRDDNNVPKLSSQIPNHTIGNGSYGCSSTLQGISNGWYDTYSSSLDGMWIDIPPGTCNGNYYIVVQIDPNQNMVELNENNNVIAVPVTLTNQSPPGSPVVAINANRPGTILPGQSVTLTATAGTSYTWSPGGATTQSITVNNAGSYTCTVTNYCGTATSPPFVVTVLPAAPAPVTTGASICGGSTATLTATNGGTGTMKWYNSPTSTIPLTTGSTYTTPVLTNTTTYYVENEVTTTGATAHVGPLTNTIGTGAYQTTAPSNAWYLQFDAVSDITLQTVKVYASTTGNRTFILQDRASTQLKSQTINIPSTGANVITLNWNISAGEGYKILVSGTPNLYYNTSGVSYPYHVPGICKITGSYSGHSNYTFFYDLVVKTPDLVAKSGKVPVTATVTTTITVNASASQNSICPGQSVTLSATGATTYSWNPGGLTGSSVVVSPSSSTTYTVTGTTAGCTGTSNVSITVNPIPVVSISGPGSICTGSSATLTASGAASFLWSTGATTASISVSPALNTTYSVSGSTLGCTGSNSILINVTPNPVVSISGGGSICAGSSAILSASGATSYLWSTGATTASINVSPSANTTYSVTGTTSGCSGSNSALVVVNPNPVVFVSGTTSICTGSSTTLTASGAATFLWSTGATNASINVSPSVNTSYSVTGTTSGCTGSNSVLVNVNSNPVVSISGPASICAGSSATLTASGAAAFLWSTGATTASISVSPILNTTYSVTGTTLGCTGTNSVLINVNPNPVVSVSGGGSICAGSSATLSASGATSFLWSTGATTASINVSPSVNTTYSVTGTTSGCSGSNSALVVVNPNPVVSISAPGSICNGTSATLTASGAASFLWSTGATTASISVSPAVNTSYSVTGTTSGCTGSNSVLVNVNSNPVVSISGPASICSGSSATLTASGAAAFLWSTGATSASINVSPVINTTYSVTGTSSGCTGSNSSSVIINSNPSVNTSNTGVSCFGGTNGTATAVVSGGTPGYNYLWNTIPLQTSSTATGLASGTYTVNISDANGCTAVRMQTVNQPPQLTGSATVTNTSCGGINGAINLTPSGGVTPYSYVWTPGGAGSQDLSGIASGLYSVLITDANGCTSGQSFTVGSNTTAPAAPAGINGSTYVCKGTTGNQFSVAPVNGATSYIWSIPPGASITSGQGTSTVTLSFSSNQNSGNICVYATNSCGNSTSICKAITVVTSKPGVPASISGPVTVCPGTNGISFSCPLVAKAEFYNWTLPAGLSFASGAGTNNITVNAASNYTGGFIRVSASNCKGTSGLKSLQLYSIPSMPGTITGSATVCANQTGVTYSVAAIPAATSYSWTLPAGVIITNGSGTNSITVTYGSSSGTVAVRAVNTCGQSNARNLAVNISCRFAAPQLNFTMFPNPAQKQVTISFNTAIDSPYLITIIDFTGRKISEIPGTAVEGNNQVEIDVSAFVKGIYLVSYEEQDVRILKKLVVE